MYILLHIVYILPKK